MEDALIEMCLAGTFDWRVEDIFEALWGSKSTSATIGERKKQGVCPHRELAQLSLAGRELPLLCPRGMYLCLPVP